MQLDPQEFLAAFLPGEDRVLTRTGVEIHCLQYWGDGLEPWVGQRVKVLVHYDPRDITYVYVRTPGGALVKAPVTTPGIPAISLAEWSACRQHEISAGRDPDLVKQADESLLRNNATVKQAKASRKQKRRTATAAAGDKYRSESCPSPPVEQGGVDEIPSNAVPDNDFDLQPFAIEDFDYEL